MGARWQHVHSTYLRPIYPLLVRNILCHYLADPSISFSKLQGKTPAAATHMVGEATINSRTSTLKSFNQRNVGTHNMRNILLKFYTSEFIVWQFLKN